MTKTKINEVFEVLAKPFHPDDVEWRLQKSVKGGNSPVLAYITARGVMNRLDEAVGPANWDMTLSPIDMGSSSKLDKFGNQTDYKGFICTLTLRITDEFGKVHIVTRQDASNLTDFEAIKGGASGAIKRAAVQFGIGRYLYGLGETWVQTDAKGKFKTPRLPDWALPEGFKYTDEPEKEVNVADDWDSAPVYDDMTNTVSSGDSEDMVVTFGKHNGKRFSEIPIDYIQWLADNAQKVDIKNAAVAWVSKHGGAGSEDAPW